MSCVTCSNELENNASEGIPNIEISHNLIPVFDETQEGQVTLVKINKEVAQKIGYAIFNIFSLDSKRLLVFDQDRVLISCVDLNGNLLWQLEPPSPDLKQYTSVTCIAVDSYGERIFVLDFGTRKIDVFTYDGNYVESFPWVPNIDMAVLRSGQLIHDVSAIDPYLYSEGEQVYRFLSIEDDEEVVAHIPIDYDFIEYVSIGYNNRFNWVGGQLQHRRPLEDTLYSVDDAIEITPELTITFNPGPQFADFLDNPEYTYPSRHFRENSIPRAHLMIKDGDKSFVTYFKGTEDERYFAYFKGKEPVLGPSHYYAINNVVVGPAERYSEGAFYHTMFKYKYDFLQQAYEENMSLEQIKSSLDSLDEVYQDNDDLFIIKAKF